MIRAEFAEDAFGDTRVSLCVDLSASNDAVLVSIEGDLEFPPVFFSPDQARRIAAALNDAASQCDGTGTAPLFQEG